MFLHQGIKTNQADVKAITSDQQGEQQFWFSSCRGGSAEFGFRPK